MDIHQSLPPIDSLGPDSAKAVSHHLRTTLRPHILHRLTQLGQLQSPDTADKIDRIELEMRLAEIDQYELTLVQDIIALDPPTPAHRMAPELAEVEVDGFSKATARAALFYSPEAVFNVHGPISLYHAAALAMTLFKPDERFAGLESVSFSKMVISQLRFTIFDPAEQAEEQHKAALKGASISGSFRLSSGRRLSFFGIQDHRYPVERMCWINRIALGLLPPGCASTFDNGVYRVRLSARIAPETLPEHGLTAPAALMTVIDTMVLMMMSKTIHSDETKLLLAIRNLPMSADPLNDLLIDGELEFTPHLNKARKWSADIVMMPTDVVFRKYTDQPTRVFTAESNLPYHRMPVA
jgi:hypothetical protein